MSLIHPIPPNLYCAPAAIVAITGQDPMSVVIPALNRAMGRTELHDVVTGTTILAAATVLDELGFWVRRYKHKQRHTLETWAEKSVMLYRGHRLLVATNDHIMVLVNGRVFDTKRPFGAPGNQHPERVRIIIYAAIIQEKR